VVPSVPTPIVRARVLRGWFLVAGKADVQRAWTTPGLHLSYVYTVRFGFHEYAEIAADSCCPWPIVGSFASEL
jgi:hypothetical protein